MNIVDISPRYHSAYFACLEEWSDEIKEAGDHKSCWFNKYKDRGLRVKLAVEEGKGAVGMIQYLPAEESTIAGQGLYFILCIWVHGYPQGIGNHQKRGIGQALLQAAEADAKALGAKGMAAWGIWLPFWMRASWFKKHGYGKADRQGLSLLLWKAFTAEAKPPRFIRKKKTPSSIPGKVAVTAFINGWCPAQGITHERARRASGEFGDEVIFRTIDTSDNNTFLEWGISDAIFIDEKQVGWGPPLSYEKIRAAIQKRVKKLKG
ncbi:MAG: GNAT family N-acetyltransferase [Nitrospinae bacterium]|nr:GNAT family N-acetyltransferase [Nitrospinota bacterium]